MNNEVHFILDENKLFFEQMLIELDTPIFYICKDENGKRYSVLCIDSDIPLYIIAAVSTQKLLNMLEKKSTMRDLFIFNSNVWKVESYEKIEDDIIETVPSNLLTDIELPAMGAFYEIYNKSISDYFLLLESEEYVKS